MLRNLFRKLFSSAAKRGCHRAASRPAPIRPRLEQLEDRLVPAFLANGTELYTLGTDANERLEYGSGPLVDDPNSWQAGINPDPNAVDYAPNWDTVQNEDDGFGFVPSRVFLFAGDGDQDAAEVQLTQKNLDDLWITGAEAITITLNQAHVGELRIIGGVSDISIQGGSVGKIIFTGTSAAYESMIVDINGASVGEVEGFGFGGDDYLAVHVRGGATVGDVTFYGGSEDDGLWLRVNSGQVGNVLFSGWTGEDDFQLQLLDGNVQQIEFRGYDGADSMTVVKGAGDHGTLMFKGEDGDDSLTMTGAPLEAATYLGGDGVDSLTVDGTSGPDAFALFSGLVLLEHVTNFADVEQVTFNGNGGADTFRLHELPPGMEVTINGGAGADEIVVEHDFNAAARAYTLDGRALSYGSPVVRGSIATIEFASDVEKLSIDAGLAGDVLYVKTAISGFTVDFHGGGGSDKVNYTVPTFYLGNWWSITGDNAGDVNSKVYFASVENLQGGASADWFRMLVLGKSISGGINGGGGTDLLDYSFWSTSYGIRGVYVNLKMQTAGALEGFISGDVLHPYQVQGIEQVFGSAGADILIGDDGNNTLNGMAGKDLIIGGLGADTVTGGAGEDLLIANTTDHDANKVALLSIWQYWRTHANTQATRDYLWSSAPYKLNFTTVQPDSSLDSVNGNDEDFVFADA